jgi:hypothetical protein
MVCVRHGGSTLILIKLFGSSISKMIRQVCGLSPSGVTGQRFG